MKWIHMIIYLSRDIQWKNNSDIRDKVNQQIKFDYEKNYLRNIPDPGTFYPMFIGTGIEECCCFI